MMKVSIVIPVYNTENYVGDCVESALNQSYEDIEILVVNDGSTDSTGSILEKYKDRVKIFDKKNEGTASALNTGIKNMTGEWFKWLSADDLLKPDAIEKLVSEIKKLGSDAQNYIFYSSYDFIDKNGHQIDVFNEPNYNSINSFERNVILLDHYYGNGTTSIMHKSIFYECGMFDEALRYKDDYEFWLRCCVLFDYKLHLIDGNLAQYRIHESQLTKKRYGDSLEQINFIRSKIIEQLSPVLQAKYRDALKKYQKQKPLKIKIRRKIRDVMFSILPKNVFGRILQMYMERKKIRN